MLGLLIVIVGILILGYIVLTSSPLKNLVLEDEGQKTKVESPIATGLVTEQGTEQPNFQMPQIAQNETNKEILDVKAFLDSPVIAKIVSPPRITNFEEHLIYEQPAMTPTPYEDIATGYEDIAGGYEFFTNKLPVPRG